MVSYLENGASATGTASASSSNHNRRNSNGNTNQKGKITTRAPWVHAFDQKHSCFSALCQTKPSWAKPPCHQHHLVSSVVSQTKFISICNVSGNTNALWPTKQSNPNQKKNEVDYPRVRPSRHVVRPGRHWPACSINHVRVRVREIGCGSPAPRTPTTDSTQHTKTPTGAREILLG